MNGSFTKLAIKNVFIIGSILKYHFIQENGFPKVSLPLHSVHIHTSATNLDIHSPRSLPRHSPASSSPGVPQSPPAQHTLPPRGLPQFPPFPGIPLSSPPSPDYPGSLHPSCIHKKSWSFPLEPLRLSHLQPCSPGRHTPRAAFRTEHSFSVVPGGGQDPSINPGDPVGSRIQNFLDFRSSKFR